MAEVVAAEKVCGVEDDEEEEEKDDERVAEADGAETGFGVRGPFSRGPFSRGPCRLVGLALKR